MPNSAVEEITRDFPPPVVPDGVDHDDDDGYDDDGYDTSRSPRRSIVLDGPTAML
jgi:hypothetical protein